MFDFCLLNYRFGNQLVSTTGKLEKPCPYGLWHIFYSKKCAYHFLNI